MKDKKIKVAVKYINECNVKHANYKKILEYDNKQVINPREEDFEKAGYKTLEIEEEPALIWKHST